MRHIVNAQILSMAILASCSGAKDSLGIDTPEKPGTEDTVSGKVLVAYFSFTGTTKSVATTLASVTGGTLYEIVPEEAYASDNSNYYDESTRAYKEQYGPATARPAIKKMLEDADSYDIIYLGCPIWYGKAPRLMLTFLDTYKFSGKTAEDLKKWIL